MPPLTDDTALSWFAVLSRVPHALPPTLVPDGEMIIWKHDTCPPEIYWDLSLARVQAWHDLGVPPEHMWMALLSSRANVPLVTGSGFQALRKAARCSQKTLAGSMRLTQTALSRWETAPCIPGRAVPMLLAHVHYLYHFPRFGMPPAPWCAHAIGGRGRRSR